MVVHPFSSVSTILSTTSTFVGYRNNVAVKKICEIRENPQLPPRLSVCPSTPEEKPPKILIQSCLTDRIPPIHTQEAFYPPILQRIAGIGGRSGPPGSQNAFRHGLAGIAQRRADGVLNPAEHSIREEILGGLLAEGRSCADQPPRCVCWRRSSPATCPLLVTFNHAIDGSFRTTPKPEPIPKHWRN